MALRLSATVIAAALGAIALILAAGSALGAMAPVAPTPPARQALARSAAARLFAAFPAIAGALQVSADPSVGGALANAGSGAPSMSRGLVDYTAYYTVASDGTFDAYRDVAGDLPPGEAQSLPSFGGGAIDETLDLYQPEAGLVLEGARDCRCRHLRHQPLRDPGRRVGDPTATAPGERGADRQDQFGGGVLGHAEL